MGIGFTSSDGALGLESDEQTNRPDQGCHTMSF